MKKVFTIVSALMLTLSANALSIKVGLATLTSDATFNVDEQEYNEEQDVYDYVFGGSISSTTGTVVVDITRSEVAVVKDMFDEDYFDTFCVNNCVSGNGELKQTQTFSGVGSGLKPSVLHLTCPVVDGKTFTYNYKFTDGEESLTLTLIYGMPEGVENVRQEAVRQGVFTIFGQQLRRDNSTEDLPAGIYIVGGKKMVIK